MKLVAERQSGVATETELACIERDEQVSLAELGLTLAEAKQLTAALQAEIMPAQMAALSAGVVQKVPSPGTPEIDRTLIVRGFLALRVILI